MMASVFVKLIVALETKWTFSKGFYFCSQTRAGCLFDRNIPNMHILYAFFLNQLLIKRILYNKKITEMVSSIYNKSDKMNVWLLINMHLD